MIRNRTTPIRSTWRRTRFVAAASAVAFVATVAAGITPSGAQEPETGAIRNGTATAVAGIGKYAPGVGQLELGMTSGTSVAQVTNFLGQASSQNTDMGLIGVSVTSEDCEGNTYISQDQLPQPTTVDNRDGDASATRDEFGTTDSPQGGGRMHVEAYEDPPAAIAETTLSDTALDPALSFDGGISHAEARVLPGEGREAYARSEGDLSLGGGVVTMSGMVWHAYHRTGVDPLVEAGFEYDDSTVGGRSYDPSDVEAFETAANTALAEFGITMTFPRVERFTEPNDIIRVTPMRIELRDSPVGKTALGPVLDATRDQREQLFDTIVGYYCGASSALLVGDIFISVISGTGFFTVEFGGASASSADLEVFDPFSGTGVPPVTTPVTPGATPTSTSPPNVAATSVVGPGPSPTTTAPVRVDAVPVASGPLEDICRSIHPRGDSCRGDAALAVGLLGLLATVGVGGADLFRHRRGTAARGV